MNEPENISELFSPGSGVVKRVDEEERHGSGHTTRQDVHGELLGLAGILGGGEGDLNGILEGKVKSLSREVSEHIGQVSYRQKCKKKSELSNHFQPLQKG